MSSHKKEMKRVKELVDDQISKAKEDKGLILVLTGEGKGKSSSGFGMALRCLGHGMKVGVAQFIKGDWETGEARFCGSHPDVQYHAMGGGFTWNTQDKEGDIQRTMQCWEKACELLSDESLGYVLLDELNVVLSFGYLDTKEVLAKLQSKPAQMHVVVTGRGAPKELLEVADTVSVVESPKHAFDHGVRAQRGIEF